MSDLIGAGTAETIVFIAATALAIASALGVVLSGNPFRSALWLILNLVSLATFYLLLNADFLAAAQVIVYAGAVMIMFLFVIAYLGGAADEPSRDTPVWQLAAALIAGGALVTEVVLAITSHEFGGAPPNSWDVIASTTSVTSAPPAISAAASCQTGVSRDGSSAAPPRYAITNRNMIITAPA